MRKAPGILKLTQKGAFIASSATLASSMKNGALYAAMALVFAQAPSDFDPRASRTSSPEPVAQAAATSAVPKPASAPLASFDTCSPLRVAPAVPTTLPGLDPQLPPIVDAREAMAPLYARLAASMRGATREPVRIAVYGDSNGTMDFMTGEMRRILQTRYGDSGHGFVALVKPWNWYRHRDVKHDHYVNAWEAFTVTTHPTPTTDDPWYGHAFIAAQSRQPGALTWVATADANAPVGRNVSRFEVYYLEWPRGGTFDVRVDGELGAIVTTRTDKAQAGFVRVEVPDGPHRANIVARTAKPVRLFGAVLERDGPGVQVDGLGVGSLNCLTMLREDEALDRAILRHRKYDLVVVHIGSNSFFARDHAGCMKQLVARYRAALPDAAILLMTPPDQLEKAWLARVNDDLRRVAAETGVAFFDFREAMGGEGSMRRFQELDLTQKDFTHFNERGGAFMGARLVAAIERDFARWAAAHPRAGCD
jgi:lysophospholipase L1-like esterase